MSSSYTVSYLENTTGGFSFFNFFKHKEKAKCGKCRNHAVMEITDIEDENNKIKLCIECYNFYSIENILRYQKHGPRMV